MPLSEPVERELSHTRQVTCRGYKRSDGLWDIEAHLLDTKAFDIDLHDKGILPAGNALHEMGLRITVDLDLNIFKAEALIENSPYHMCPSIAERYKLLEGLQIAPGFTRKTRELFGGVKGCTHLLELLGPLATTAYQTTHLVRQEEWESSSAPQPLLNTCHSFAEDSEVVKKYWPEHYIPHNKEE